MNKYNTFWRRFFAGFIDGLLLMPIAALDYFLEESNNVYLLTTILFLTYSSFYIYTVLLHWQSGQTLGKRWMDIRVVDQSETRLLTFKQSFMRDSVYIVLEVTAMLVIMINVIRMGHYPAAGLGIPDYLGSLEVIWFFTEVITMLTNEKRRALHDLMAGSVVIKEEFWNNRYESTPR